ncbi:MAG: endonuclease MutS2 [Clostridia bacterium]|nr:endonuclease MutS2 [Clostridia bacterium]
MKAFEKAVGILEYNKILEHLASLCSVEAGKEKILTLRPEADAERVVFLQKETAVAKKVSAVKGNPSLSAHPLIPGILDRAEKNAVLNPAELMRVGAMLRSVELARRYGESLEGDDAVLGQIFRRLIPERSLEKEISRCIISEDSLSDDASPTLHSIRRKMANCAARIRESLQHYISGAYGNFLQENIITFRNSRYVIPVKSEYKNEIKGLVHDTSASGATVFIEPASVVELNNQIKLLEGEERDEIERILAALSQRVASFSDALRLNFYNVVELSVIFARAELAVKMDAARPKISRNGVLELDRARHPLLDRKTAVPISLTLGKNYDTLVITGPNTGGKTVTLKTIGLLSMMAQTGLQIPAEESTFPVYPDILADIGDEQSIEQSLSTFSAHIVNIISILENAVPGALMLFDELGSGTDPIEGAALAEAVLEHVRKQGVKCAATTHYAELKTYALETEGVENASCEFDITTLKPTYRLIIGTPGRSNAFLISTRLGLPKVIIDQAQILIKAENRRFETVVGRLEEERVAMEKDREEARRLLAEAKEMQAGTLKEREGLLAGAEKELERAKKEALRLVKSARALSDSTIEKLEEMQKKALKNQAQADLEEERRKLRLTLRGAEDEISSQMIEVEEDREQYTLPRPLKIGDQVLVSKVGKEGTVEKLQGSEAVVQVGNLRMKTPVSDLRLITGLKKAQKQQKKGGVSSSPRAHISNSVDVRGLVTDDAWFVVDKYLDDVILTGFESVTVIHGKGTGALKAGLWRYFKKDPRIRAYRLGLYGEGDGGVTILEMKK